MGKAAPGMEEKFIPSLEVYWRPILKITILIPMMWQIIKVNK